jgi:GH43 family beta-xylosidase
VSKTGVARQTRLKKKPGQNRFETMFPPRNSSGSLSLIQESATYTNPILPAHAADPWMVQHEGAYYYCESRNQHTIHVRKSKSITDVVQDDGACVWSPPYYGMNSKNVWAPELHFLNGKWYIYFAADDGENENHRMWVLESEGTDPQGKYIERGCLETDGWAIDGTVLQMDDGKLYFIWSGWPGKVNGRQNLYIAPMQDPITISGPRVLICSPDLPWETVDMAIAEGPQILKRNGKVFLVYSASGSWTVDYCLGLMVHTSGDVLEPAAWQKHGPVFQKTSEVWGVGHCSFVKSPDQNEDWILYHAKSKRKKGWLDRHVHAQSFTWDAKGFPNFSVPIPAGVPLPIPAA